MRICNGKTLYYWRSKLKNFKSHSLQIMYNFRIWPEIEFRSDLSGSFGCFCFIHINLFKLFEVHIWSEKECDHAGWQFNLLILGLEFEYTHQDCRHWDYDSNDWEKEQDADEQCTK